MQRSVLIAEPEKAYIDETLIENHPPSINPTLSLVKNKQCQEVDRRFRVMLSKPLDLKLTPELEAIEEDDNADDGDNNKKQTIKNSAKT
jgi:hypothetical protein